MSYYGNVKERRFLSFFFVILTQFFESDAFFNCMRYILELDATAEIDAIFLGLYAIHCRFWRYYLKMDAIFLDFDNLSWIGHCFNCTLFIVESDDIFWRWTLFFLNCTYVMYSRIDWALLFNSLHYYLTIRKSI